MARASSASVVGEVSVGTVTAPLVERHRLPALRSLDVVVHGLLGEGVAASTRQDGRAECLGERLRARYADVPVALLEDGA